MMPEDQERFEDYLDLEQYIDKLQAGRVALPPQDVTRSQLHIYQMATLFHTASSEASQPSAEFAEQLKASLLVQRKKLLEAGESEPSLAEKTAQLKSPQPPQEPTVREPLAHGILENRELAAEPAPVISSRKKGVSRRALLTGGTSIAASLAVGAGIDRVIESRAVDPTASSTPQAIVTSPLVGNVPVTWHLAATVDQLSQGPIRFVAEAVVGYVLYDGPDAAQAEAIIAMSAACTHMGCIVKWQENDRRFHCPCHNGMFDASGYPAISARSARKSPYLASLPRLDVKVEEGNIYVRVPSSNV